MKSWWLIGSLAGVVGLIAMFLYMEHGDWPADYHHDEPSKVAQLAENQRNLNHPLLLLEAAEWTRLAKGVSREDSVAILRSGRTVSAACMALALAVMVLAAARRASWVSGLMVGVVTLLYFRFYEVGHYFKEDTPFLLGMALVLWAASERMRSQTTRTAMMLGLAAGFAASAKYAGVGALAIVLPVAVLYPGGSWKRACGVVLGGALAWFLLMHGRLLFMENPLEVLTASVSQETAWLVQGHKGIGTEVPNWDYAKRLWFDLGFHGWLLLALWVPLHRLMRKGDVVIILFAVILFVILTMSRKYSERYVLPISMISLFYVGIQMGNLVELSKRWFRRKRWIAPMVGAGVLAMVVVPWYPWLAKHRAAFAEDSRALLCQYLEKELPAEAVLAVDAMVHLTVAQQRHGGRARDIRVAEYVPELGTLAELKASGVTHVIICYDTYHRFVDEGAVTVGAQSDEWEAAREFYLRLKEETLLWSSEPRDPKPLHPGLELYALPANL